SPELSPIRLRALFALITQISSAETRPLDAALDVVLSATPAVAGAAFARGGKLVPAATRGFGNRSRGTTRALRALADRALANGAPTRLADVESDREGIEDARELKKVGGRTALALPLVVTRTPVGALVLVFRHESALEPYTRPFTDAAARVTEHARGSPTWRAIAKASKTRASSRRSAIARRSRCPSSARARPSARSCSSFATSRRSTPTRSRSSTPSRA